MLVPAQPVGQTVGQGAVAVMVAVVGQLGFTPGCVVVSIFRQAGTKQAPPEALGHGQPEGVTVVLAVKQPQGAGQVAMPVPGRVVKGLCASLWLGHVGLWVFRGACVDGYGKGKGCVVGVEGTNNPGSWRG